jgi:hypothetical protein
LGGLGRHCAAPRRAWHRLRLQHRDAGRPPGSARGGRGARASRRPTLVVGRQLSGSGHRDAERAPYARGRAGADSARIRRRHSQLMGCPSFMARWI